MTVADLTKDEFHGFEPSTGLLRFLSNVTGAHVETLGSESGVNVSGLASIDLVLTCSIGSRR